MKNIILIVFAFISLALGILGIFLPVLPTTPFLLLSAFLLARSSSKYYQWLINNKYLGSYILDFQHNKAIPRHIKLYSISLLWLTMICTIFFAVCTMLWLQILLALIAIAVTIHILSYKTKQLPTIQPPQPHKEYLYTGLLLLVFAFILKHTSTQIWYFRIFLAGAIFYKTIFLVSVFRIKALKLSSAMILILCGVILILLSCIFKYLFHVPILRNILFYAAIALKVSGLIIMLLKNKTKSCH